MGIAQYAQECGGWDFTRPKADEYGEVDLPAGWQGDGIICRLTSHRLEKQIVRTGLPAVNVSWLGNHSSNIIKVVSSEVACGRMAAEYFQERYFRHFAFIGPPPNQRYHRTIADSLIDAVSERGCDLHEFSFPRKHTSPTDLRAALQRWLKELPKPTAVIAWNSEFGRVVTTICVEEGLSIPDQVSIVCIEHDDLESALSPIPLSNVDQDAWQVGYSSARWLDELMKGATPPSAPITVPPLSIVQRKSSEASAVDDPLVRDAYRLIHEHVGAGINVDELVRRMHVSRRTLESRFRDILGNTPGHFIRRTRIQLVKRLLRETTLSIPEIAERSGFGSAEALIRAFKRETQATPTQFRSAIGS